MPYHWTVRLSSDEADVLKKFLCSDEWLASFSNEEEVQDLEVEGAPMLDASQFGSTELYALQNLEGNAYVWPLGSNHWCLDEYGLPIWLALHGYESSCTVEVNS